MDALLGTRQTDAAAAPPVVAADTPPGDPERRSPPPRLLSLREVRMRGRRRIAMDAGVQRLHAWIPRPASARCCPVFTHARPHDIPLRAHTVHVIPIRPWRPGHLRDMKHMRWISRLIHAWREAVRRTGCVCCAPYPRLDTPGAEGRRASRLLSALHSVPDVRMRGRRGVSMERTMDFRLPPTQRTRVSSCPSSPRSAL
ncbi:hypothetical protein B0H13DRAFT_2016554 [Mycena leptocephala]|nr:hypothetical protein B0H13DRAFT_2016554 [Mycena leptocephala]